MLIPLKILTQANGLLGILNYATIWNPKEASAVSHYFTSFMTGSQHLRNLHWWMIINNVSTRHPLMVHIIERTLVLYGKF
jgi:hypothetical protein